MIASEWIPFLLACLVVELTPGPNMAYLTVLALARGRRAGLLAVAGVAFGLVLVGLLAAMGVAALMQASPMASNLLTLLGVTYLLWLAWESWREGEAQNPQATLKEEGPSRYFLRGAITNLLNPKAYLFYIALLPGMFAQGDPPPLWMLIAVSVTIATLVHTSLVLLASRWQSYLAQPVRYRHVCRCMALLLVLIALWFAVR